MKSVRLPLLFTSSNRQLRTAATLLVGLWLTTLAANGATGDRPKHTVPAPAKRASAAPVARPSKKPAAPTRAAKAPAATVAPSKPATPGKVGYLPAQKAALPVSQPNSRRQPCIGQVLDAKRRGLPGACVFVTGSRTYITATDANGWFSLQLPAVESGTLTVAYMGLVEQQIALPSDNCLPTIPLVVSLARTKTP